VSRFYFLLSSVLNLRAAAPDANGSRSSIFTGVDPAAVALALDSPLREH